LLADVEAAAAKRPAVPISPWGQTWRTRCGKVWEVLFPRAESSLPHNPPAKPDPKALSEPVAARLLERASELDAAHVANSVEVAALRAAADEAGISARAFDAALAELQQDEEASSVQSAPGKQKRFRPTWAVGAVGTLLLLTGLLVVGRLLAPANGVPADVAMVDEAYYLRCLSADDASALIRPHLALQQNSVKIGNGSRVVNVHATPAQQQEIKAVLGKYESAGSPACTVGPPAVVPR
jgi:hypothetical protein